MRDERLENAENAQEDACSAPESEPFERQWLIWKKVADEYMP